MWYGVGQFVCFPIRIACFATLQATWHYHSKRAPFSRKTLARSHSRTLRDGDAQHCNSFSWSTTLDIIRHSTQRAASCSLQAAVKWDSLSSICSALPLSWSNQTPSPLIPESMVAIGFPFALLWGYAIYISFKTNPKCYKELLNSLQGNPRLPKRFLDVFSYQTFNSKIELSKNKTRWLVLTYRKVVDSHLGSLGSSRIPFRTSENALRTPGKLQKSLVEPLITVRTSEYLGILFSKRQKLIGVFWTFLGKSSEFHWNH